MKHQRNLIVCALCATLIACQPTNTNPTTEEPQSQTSEQQTAKDMHSFVSIFEIPATDISRAIQFYEAILGIHIEPMSFPGMEMGVFPYEEEVVTGVIMQGEGYQPSATGITMYLNGGENLQTILDKVEENGGQILVPKTPHADESGFFALFLDSEGNKMGLHSPH